MQMTLITKVLKKKRLQRLSGSLAFIVPNAWIREMNWKKLTPFVMEFRPFTKQIVITEEKQDNGEKACKSILV